MGMPVMNVGEVSMTMAQPPVLMLVSMRLDAVPVEVVLMPMMLIMCVSM